MKFTDSFYARDELDREYDPSRKPIVKKYDISEMSLDPELRKLKYVMASPSNKNNREYCFWISSTAQAFSYITASIIIGDGLRIRCENKRAKEIIENFNQEINVNGETIEEYITSTWIDELNHARSTWRIAESKYLDSIIDIQRVDPKTLKKVKDAKEGWTGYVQTVGDYQSYRTKKQFYRNLSKQYRERVMYPPTVKDVEIPDEPDVLLRTSFFIEPPIASAIQYIIYKKIILYFMRKYSQKLWTPFLLFLIGDPKTPHYPDSPHEMQQAINDMAEIIPEIVSFGGASIPGNVIPIEIGKGSAKESLSFIEYMNFLDKQIITAIFGSKSLMESSGVELATSRTHMEILQFFIKGIRRKYSNRLVRFYTKALLPAHGIELKARELFVEFPPLKVEGSKELMEAIQIAVNIGMLKDRKELRKAGQMVLSWLNEEVDNNASIPFPPPQLKPQLPQTTDTVSRIRSVAKK